MVVKVGDEFPVWWSTGVRRGNWNYAIVLEIKPYTGKYKDWFCNVLRLTCPSILKKGYTEMAVSRYDMGLEE